MIDPKQATELILEHTSVLSAETLSLAHAVERILDEELHAKNDLPSFDNSAMDGFALRCDYWANGSRTNPVFLKVSETIKAGSSGRGAVHSGEAVKIMTGAPIPSGADAVVMKEMTEEDGNNIVKILNIPKPGDHIRKKGEDVQSGTLLLKKGTRIRPYEVALLASQGIAEVLVIRSPRVSILATGDELLEVSEPLSFGKIRNSNGPALGSALFRWGVDVIDQKKLGDKREELEVNFKSALTDADLVLITGGVSAGDFDHTRLILLKLGVREVFWKVAVKPGKPLFFGIYGEGSGCAGKPVFGLPGNPVSALVCLEEFVRPALEKMRGYRPDHPSYHLKGKVLNGCPKPADRQQYLFCQASRPAEDFHIQILRPQGSAMMGMACKANALAVAPIGQNCIAPGDILPFRWLK